MSSRARTCGGRASRGGAALLGVVLLAACAAQEKSAAPPSASDKAAGSATGGAPPAPAFDEDREAAGETPRAAIARAKVDIDRAERELLTSAGDCAAACRALASMERATGHLCALSHSAAAGAEDERARCDEATAKVLSARERVRSTCGVCEGGPSLDRTAPIPSVRP
jgi:hypothetical protein